MNFRTRNLTRSASVILLLIFFCGAANVERIERLIESWQPTHFDVALTFDNELSQITAARADVSILVLKNDVTSIDFDFGSMPVSAVQVNNETARFVQREGKLDVYLAAPAQNNQKLIVSVFYSGVPTDGLILSKDKDGNPSAVGDNWADRVHNWIPCLDHPSAKATVRFTVTAPAKFEVVGNGVLESAKANESGSKTWIWSETNKISPYNMVIAAGMFATAPLKTRSAFPISYYVPISDRQFAEQGFAPAAPSVETFSNLVKAPYPYKKLALIVGATKFGGMENANTIVFTPNLFRNFADAQPRSQRYQIPQNVTVLVAHEIAHQWFGNEVTEATWADLWLSEGFATYFAGVFLEKNESPAAFRRYMAQNAENYFQYAKVRRAPVHDRQTPKLFDLLNPNNYEKGAWVLHMLRENLGERAFFDGISLYYNTHKSGTATTEDLRRALEKTSGKNLKTFFDRWIYGAGHPVYGVSWQPAGKNTIEITLLQTQPEEFFAQPVALEINADKQKRRVVVTPDSKETRVKVKIARPKSIVIDPDDAVLNEIEN